MKLKEIESVKIGITNYGKIVLEQTTAEVNFIYIAYDQFLQLNEWVEDNKKAILDLWNEGIDLGDDDETDS